MELEGRMKEFDWSVTFYDPLHDSMQAETDEEKICFERLETLIQDLQVISKSSPQANSFVEDLVNRHWKAHPMEDQIEGLLSKQKVEMMTSHVISDEVFNELLRELSSNRNWIAYNKQSYYLEKGDVYFFQNRDEAKEFASNNYSDYDNYKVIYANSIVDVFKQIPYGQSSNEQLNHILNSSKNIHMNQQNYDYLKDNIKYMGFGEKQNDALEEQLKAGKDSFQLTFRAEINKSL